MKLVVRELSLARSGRKLLNSVSLELTTGLVTTLVGPNGAGKSTLVDVVSGYSGYETGSCQLNGRAIAQFSVAERARMLAVLPQNSTLSFPFTVHEVITMGRIPCGRPANDEMVIEAVIAELALDSLRHRIFTTLSGGEQQRTQIARVLVQVWDQLQDSLLILDEPLSSLDMAHQLDLLELFRRLAAKGATILLVLHDLNLASRFSDALILMSEGSVRLAALPSEVLTHPDFERVMGVKSELVYSAGGVPQLIFRR